MAIFKRLQEFLFVSPLYLLTLFFDLTQPLLTGHVAPHLCMPYAPPIVLQILDNLLAQKIQYECATQYFSCVVRLLWSRSYIWPWLWYKNGSNTLHDKNGEFFAISWTSPEYVVWNWNLKLVIGQYIVSIFLKGEGVVRGNILDGYSDRDR